MLKSKFCCILKKVAVRTIPEHIKTATTYINARDNSSVTNKVKGDEYCEFFNKSMQALSKLDPILL